MYTMQAFFDQYHTKRYQKGATILHQDALPGAVYAVKEGVVKVYNLTAHGEEKPVGFATQSEVIPLGWVFGMTNRSQYYYEAFSDCLLYRLPKADYLAFIKSNQAALFETLQLCIKRLVDQQMRINALGQSKASQKVLNIIHYMALYFGRDLRPDVVEIPLPLTQQDIANCVGMTRETTNTELKKLVAQKIIFHRGQTYVVRTDKLNELLDDDYGHRLARYA